MSIMKKAKQAAGRAKCDKCKFWLNQTCIDPRVEAIKQLQEANPSDEGVQNWANDVLYETEEVENERIRKALIAFIKKRDRSGCDYDYDKWIAWLEKQGKQKLKKVPIWKHWKDGIAGNGEGKQTYLIKNGLTYSISSCLGNECDYIELSELDKLLQEEKQGNKPKWTEEDDEEFKIAIETLHEAGQHSSAMWLKSIKQRIAQ